MQCLGSISGFLLSYYLNNGIVFQIKVGQEISDFHAFFTEILCSFILYLEIIINYHNNINNPSDYSIQSLVDVFGVATGIAIGGNVSGAGMNPAIGLGANFVRFLITGNLNEVRYLYIYIIAPFIASYLVAKFYVNIYISDSKIIKNANRYIKIKNYFK
jgi:glycerol uptake facilitator-like aquaporin